MKPAILLALLLGTVGLAHAGTFETASFIIQIEDCGPGVVSCDDVKYTGTSKKTGKTIVLRGRTDHSMCADGVTPCRFRGYVFQNGATEYWVDERGELVVTRGRKTLVKERGEWK